jgi:UDPglucose--hexose-1-phosphate uridylyltransferase
MPELRKDPVVGRWVIIATERRKRPTDFVVKGEACMIDSAACPFCEGNEKKTPPEIIAYRHGSLPNERGWTVRVVPNKFPALAIEGDLDRVGEGMFDKMNGVGAHEVIIETPRHVCNFDALPEPEVQSIIRAYRDRVADLKGDRRMKYILIFKNKGREAGASLDHSHSQLIALPIVPKRVLEELEGSREYYRFKERCVFCDIIRQEIQDGTRVVFENERFLCLSPFAPKSPFETWVLPKNHEARFEHITEDEIKDLAQIMHRLMNKMTEVLKDPPYNYIVHTAPLHENPAHFHWHIEIMPKLTQLAGFEWGSGFYINPTPPEDAARELRGIGEA